MKYDMNFKVTQNIVNLEKKRENVGTPKNISVLFN